jgi:murein DD-endopeptidase MepM/ murein hydrolase activator NlpD
MQKNDKAYAFLFSHSSKSRIYIKRVEISKGFLRLGSLGTLLLLIAAGAAGIYTVTKTNFVETVSASSFLNQISARPTQNEPAPEPAVEANDFAFNSGGPEGDNESDGETTQLENQLRAIGANASPSSLPTIWAHLGKINNEFGFRRNPFGGRAYEFHPGMDIDGERGDLVVSPASGTVIAAGYKGGYGNMVEVDHGNGLTTRYGHLSKIEAQIGDIVTRGQLLAYIGSTGRSTGPHLHYELRLNDRPINPRHFLPPEPTDLTKIVRQ